ncbi:hypothetical protein CYMTET_27528 [Cymbomonas tetramitiformis]|uniref:Uncharacterized protein n=1 Tax=Cymbomonas tetramitiformis TaxID=36881 RepID=A0AAE0FQ60_9CHLO|nr:hypothetical protein CYMTET_27528 [Cymbomonas tetramitiformis]
MDMPWQAAAMRVHAAAEESTYADIEIASTVNNITCPTEGVVMNLEPGTQSINLQVYVVGMEWISTDYLLLVTRLPKENPLLVELNSDPASEDGIDFFALTPAFDPNTTVYEMSLPYNHMWVSFQVATESGFGAVIGSQDVGASSSAWTTVNYPTYGWSLTEITLYSQSDASREVLTIYTMRGALLYAAPPRFCTVFSKE